MLRPTLYAALERRFGRGNVTVACENEEMLAHITSASGRSELRVEEGGEYLRVNCFAPETLVVTKNGDIPIEKLVGRVELLIPNTKHTGFWRDAEVKSFGRQSLLTITLKRGLNSVKKIRVTKDHRWLLFGNNQPVITEQLKKGDMLASCYARGLSSYRTPPMPSAVGIAQGFVFGDGSKEKSSHKPAHADFYATKDLALLTYFSSCRRKVIISRGKSIYRVLDLPRTWKELPDINESLSFLLGWFSGYFAADGTVSSSGLGAVIYSVNPDNLNFVKAICYRLGVKTCPIITKMRIGFGINRPISSMAFGARDLPESFWLIQHHRQRIVEAKLKTRSRSQRHWRVESVENLGESSEVYCAVVPGVEKFTLSDNLLTMNCPYCNDTRRRLWINYRWGLWDEQTRSRNLFLCICYNENCFSEQGRSKDLYDELFSQFDDEFEDDVVEVGEVVEHEPIKVTFPGFVYPLSRFVSSHPAITYLKSRGYDINFLNDVMKVGFCEHAGDYHVLRNRLVIPIYKNDVMVGWQARIICDGVSKNFAKYFNCPGMKRNRMLYNYDVAKQYPFVVLCEGCTDVWSFGPEAVALFGKTASGYQLGEIVQTWKEVYVCLDGDAVIDAQGIYDALGNKVKKALVKLPPKEDPGSMPRALLRDTVFNTPLQ